MNTLVERIKRHQDAGHAQRTATRRNPSIAAFLVCGMALALMMTACFSPSPTRPPSTATPVPSGMVDAHSTTLPTRIEKNASSPPTSTAVAITPEPTARPTVPTATPNPDWVEYRNELFGYRLSLPEQASVEELGPEYFPADQLPPGTTADAYLEQLASAIGGCAFGWSTDWATCTSPRR